MEETPREYKKRIDEQRATRRRNRDKLIECLEGYELIDESYKAKTKQEILVNFEKNERSEKDSEFYTKIGEELKSIDQKYTALENLKSNLEKKLEERQKLEEILREQKFDGKDKTTISIQMKNMQKTRAEFEKLSKEIDDLKKEIQDRENEMKEIEEVYGKKFEDENDIPEDNIIESKEKQIKSKKMKKPTGKTLSEYRQNVISILQKLNESKDEMIKLLGEGIGVDDNIRKEIEDEITIRYNRYKEEMEGSLRMKAANHLNVRDKIIDEELNFDEKIVHNIDLGGKPLVILKKNQKYRLIWGDKQCGDWFDSIDQSSIREIGGKPCFKATFDHFEYVMRGEQQCGGHFIKVECLIDASGEPLFLGGRNEEIFIVKGISEYELRASYGEYNINKLRKDGKYYLMVNGEFIDDDGYDEIGDIRKIGGKPCFRVKKDGKGYIIRGNEQYGDGFDDVRYSLDIGGRPCYEAKKDGKECIRWGENQQGERFDSIYGIPKEVGGKPFFYASNDGKYFVVRGKEKFFITTTARNGVNIPVRGRREKMGNCIDGIREPIEIGGKPCFVAKKDGEWCIMWGLEQLGDRYDYDISEPIEIGGKPYFRAKKDGKEYAFRGTEQLGDWYENIYYLQEIGGKPCFRAKRDGKYCIMWGTEQQGDWFDQVENIQEIGGKPCFEVRREDGKYYIMRGNEQLGEGYNRVGDPKEIGGKPCFKVYNNGKEYLMRGCEQLGNRFDDLCDIQEIGGKPCFRAEKDGKYHIIRGNEQLGEGYYGVGGPQEIGGKPVFIAKKDGKECMMWGNEQYSDWFDAVGEPQEIGGKPVFTGKKDGKYCLMWGKDQQGERFDSIYDTSIQIGGKPVFIGRKDGKECMMWGNEQYSDWFDDVQYPLEICGKVCYVAKKDGKLCIIWGKETQGDWFDGIYNLQEIGGKPYFIAVKDRKYRIMRRNEQLGNLFDDVEEVKEIGGKPYFKARKDGKYYIMRGNQQLGNLFDTVEGVQEIGGKPYFVAKNDRKWHVVRGNKESTLLSHKPSETEYEGKKLIVKIEYGPIKSIVFEDSDNDDLKEINIENTETSETPREKRENLILKRYQRKLNRDELLKVIESLDELDKGKKNEIREIIFNDFYINYEKAKENDEFKDADVEYKKLKKINLKCVKNEKEIKFESEHWTPEVNEIYEKLGDITSIAMELENGFFRKRRSLKKTNAEWDVSEKRLNEILDKAKKLKEKRYNLFCEIYNFERQFGFKKNRKLIDKSIEIEKYEGEEFEGLNYEKTLKGYEKKYKKIIKEKMEYFDNLIEIIKAIDIGISEKAADNVINILKGVIEQKTKMRNEGDELVKKAREIGKYINENRDKTKTKLEKLDNEIKLKEKKLEELQQLESSTNVAELMKIREEEFVLNNELIQLKEEYEKIKSEWDEKLLQYQGNE